MKKQRKYFLKSINRNIVECKCAIWFAGNWKIYVLIETLWNVNFFDACP